MRHDFPSQWSQFLNQKPTPAKRAKLTLTPSEEHYPFWIQGKLKTLTVDRVDLFARPSTGAAGQLDIYGSETPPAAGATELTTPLQKDESLGGLLAGELGGDGLPVPLKPTDKIELFFDDIKLDDLWIAVQWRS